MTLTIPLLPLSMSDTHPQRPWRLMGWRTWTVVLAAFGLVFAVWALNEAKTAQDVNRIVTTMASICGGGAFITGFLWKLVGENSLTLIKIKDDLLSAQKEQHAKEIEQHAKEIGSLTERFNKMEFEMQGLKNLNIALQTKNLTLEEKLTTLEAVKKAIERALSKAYEDKEMLTKKAEGYSEMLVLAERRIRALSEKETPK